MKIDLSNMKQELKMLEKLEEDYKNLSLNYYGKIIEIENQWNGIYEQLFMQNIEQEKKNMNITHDNIKRLNSLYKYIYLEYLELGKKIEIDFSKENEIFNRIDSCENHIHSIISICNNINTEKMTNDQIYNLNIAKNKLKKQLPKLKGIKSRLSSMYDKVKKIENNISKNISKFDIDIIQETDITDFVEH